MAKDRYGYQRFMVEIHNNDGHQENPTSKELEDKVYEFFVNVDVDVKVKPIPPNLELRFKTT